MPRRCQCRVACCRSVKVKTQVRMDFATFKNCTEQTAVFLTKHNGVMADIGVLSFGSKVQNIQAHRVFQLAESLICPAAAFFGGQHFSMGVGRITIDDNHVSVDTLAVLKLHRSLFDHQ